MTRLTRRQQDCLNLVAQGYTSKEIGRHLGISPSTVDNHLHAAAQVMGVEGRAEAARRLKRDTVQLEGKKKAAPRRTAPKLEQSSAGAGNAPAEEAEVRSTPDHRPDAPLEPGQELPRQASTLAGAQVTENDPEAITRSRDRRWRLPSAPPIGGRQNSLDVSKRLVAIGQIALVSVLFFVACVIVIRTCFDALR